MPAEGFLSVVAAPVRRAFAMEGIDTLEKLATYSEKDILKLHGVGPASLPILRAQLNEAGLTFKK